MRKVSIMRQRHIQYMNNVIIPLPNPEVFLRLKNEHKEYSYNRIRASFICSKCGVESIKTFRCINVNFLCSACMRSITHSTPEYRERYKQSLINKYGQDALLKVPDIKERAKQTYLSRYGVENPFQYEPFKEKSRQTNMANLGVQYPGQSIECRKKGTETYFNKTGFTHNMLNPESKNRVKSSTLRHFGAIGTASPLIKEKQIETIKQKYGVESYSQTDEFHEKFQATSMKHYGCPHPTQSSKIQKKIKMTMRERYGCEYCMQNIAVRTKSMSNRYRRKYMYNNIMFDSTWEISYYIWLTDNNIPFEYHPDIAITYEYNGKTCLYYPDFKVNDELHEIKGNHFFKNRKDASELVCPFDQSRDAKCAAKYKCMIENHVKILVYNDIKPYIDYVKRVYGTHYLSSCKRK